MTYRPNPAAGTEHAAPAKGVNRRRNITTVANGHVEIAVSGAVTRPLKTAERVARDITRDIVAGGLATGDSLPSEAAMLTQYEVGRESLREALRLLEVQGLITIRRGPGGGPTVGSVDPANLGRISSLYYHLSGATYRELFEAWIMAEGMLAERAARNPDAARRTQAMTPYLDDPDHVHTPEELDEYVQMHMRFHAAIAALANNRVLEITMQTFGQIVSHHVAVSDDPLRLRQEIASDHNRLARAIVAGYSSRARRIMEEHIGGVAQYSASRLGDRFDDFIEWQ